MQTILNETQWNVYQTLLKATDSLSAQELVEKTGIDHPMMAATLMQGEQDGWLTIKEIPREELVPSEDVAALMEQGLPERRVLPLLAEKGKIPMRDLADVAKELDIPIHEIIKFGGPRGWVEKDKGDLAITEAGRAAIDTPDADEKALKFAVEKGSIYLDELANQGIDVERVKMLLNNRNAVAKIKPRTLRLTLITETGRKVLSGDVKVVKERNVLTSDDITSGEWKNIQLRQYDVTLAAEKTAPAKIHPMQKIIQLTRRAFLEMGFSEIVAPQVESAFWDFDALFQPQDHPARDMQDTFYLTRPNEAKLPADDIIERIRQTHENGWTTGSTGWGYKWNIERARQTVLRTHTTASSIRALAQDPNPPRKVFCVGKVFRNEAISYKHLPEFFQVDGIIIDEHASLATLLGTLKEFYRKMGFSKVKFKPSFFPYTEPSAEVFVYMESKQAWIELGGSGVFRPEVTRPFGCNVPVLAWGLGLDRLAMMRYGFKDIRELYWSDLDRIKEVPLCQ
ncbi:phenylalanine--tRNA ligase subunit alpha [candidate division KSB1 bacterium]|nr:phenylalanine--tRNA ligase subunit alpha [candidate division KSB1 bacterium]